MAGQTLNQAGLVRLLDLGSSRYRFTRRSDSFAPDEWAKIAALRDEPKTRTSLMQEKPEERIAEAQSAGKDAKRPVLELISERGNPILYNSPEALAGAVREIASNR
ncbi:MAG: hypothetical protein ABSH09_24985 [Bryobacteraceae bacterium]|jgi:hypothetical protein